MASTSAQQQQELCGPSLQHGPGFLMLIWGISCSCATWDVLRCPQVFLKLQKTWRTRVAALPLSQQFSTGFNSLSLLEGADAISHNSCWTVLIPRSKETRVWPCAGLGLLPLHQANGPEAQGFVSGWFLSAGIAEALVECGIWMLPSVCSWECHGREAADICSSEGGGLLPLAPSCWCGFYYSGGTGFDR